MEKVNEDLSMTTKTKNPLVIKNGIEGHGVFAIEPINNNTIIFKMHGDFIDHPTQTSVQVGAKIHIEDSLAGLLNHSCTPSAKIDRQRHAVVSVHEIKKNEEITFNYSTNEDKLAVPFICRCCGKMISGKNE